MAKASSEPEHCLTPLMQNLLIGKSDCHSLHFGSNGPGGYSSQLGLHRVTYHTSSKVGVTSDEVGEYLDTLRSCCLLQPHRIIGQHRFLQHSVLFCRH